MTENSTGGSPGAGTPPEILTAANAHRSHGKTFGAGTPPLCEGLVELDRLIAKQSQSVSARRQLAETESLPALKASKARNGHPAVRAMPANPRHGKQHRSILAIEEEELLALQSARADYASQSDVARQADDAREKAEQERDAVIVTAADTIFTTTQTWIEKLAAAQAENAGLRAGGVGLIAAERQRQIEGSSDDDRYNSGQLAQSAHGLLETALGLERDYIGFPLSCARKLARRHAGNPIKLLTIAGAFIAAEIDRLNRATPTPPQERQP
jgi:hypothetical protein